MSFLKDAVAEICPPDVISKRSFQLPQDILYLAVESSSSSISCQEVTDWVDSINHRYSPTSTRPAYSPFSLSTLIQLQELLSPNSDILESPYKPPVEPPTDSLISPTPSPPTVLDLLSAHDPSAGLPEDWNFIWQQLVHVAEPPKPPVFVPPKANKHSAIGYDEKWETAVKQYQSTANELISSYKSNLLNQLYCIYEILGKFSSFCKSTVKSVVDEYCLEAKDKTMFPYIVENFITGEKGSDPLLDSYLKALETEKKQKKKMFSGGYFTSLGSAMVMEEMTRSNDYEQRGVVHGGVSFQFLTAKIHDDGTKEEQPQENQYMFNAEPPTPEVVEDFDEDYVMAENGLWEVRNIGLLTSCLILTSLRHYSKRLALLTEIANGNRVPSQNEDISIFNDCDDDVTPFEWIVKVPLAIVVDYKGFSLLCRATCPCDSNKVFGAIEVRTEVEEEEEEPQVQESNPYAYNCGFPTPSPPKKKIEISRSFNYSDLFKDNDSLQDQLSLIGRFLGLSHHTADINGSKIPTPLSVENDVYKSIKSDVFYLTELSRLTPPLICQQGDLTLSDRISPIYLMKLVHEMRSNQSLNSDAFLSLSQSEEVNIQDEEAALQVSQKIMTEFGQFVNDVDNFKYNVFSPEDLTDLLRVSGYSNKFLGLLHKYSRLPSIKKLVIVEICAHVCVFQLRNALRSSQRKLRMTPHSSIYTSNQSNPQSDLMGQSSYGGEMAIPSFNDYSMPSYDGGYDFGSPMMSSVADLDIAEKIKYFNTDIKSNIVDFFNLILGSGEETNQAWKELVLPCTFEKFHVNILKSDVCLYALFLRMSQLSGVSFKDSNEFKFGHASDCNPLTVEDLIDVVPVDYLPDLLGLPILSIDPNLDILQYHQNFSSRNLNFFGCVDAVERSLARRNYDECLKIVQNYLKIHKYHYGLRGSSTVVLMTMLSKIYSLSNNPIYGQLYCNTALSLSLRWHPCMIKVIEAQSRLSKSTLSSSDVGKFFSEQIQIAQKVSVNYFGDEDFVLFDLFAMTGKMLQNLNLFDLCNQQYSRLVRLSQKILGSIHPKTAEYLILLGDNQFRMGNLDGAQKAFETCSSIYDSLKLGGIYTISYHMAKLCNAKGDFSNALDHVDKSITCFTSELGKFDGKTLSSLRLKCDILINAGKFTLAVQHLDELISVLKAAEETIGPEILIDEIDHEIVDLVQQNLVLAVKCFLKSLSRKRYALVAELISLKKINSFSDDQIGEVIRRLYSEKVFSYLSELFQMIDLG
ncbi:hypothetical protein GEMRC1_007505 [Eukaryota sp. GEM-RC1]